MIVNVCYVLGRITWNIDVPIHREEACFTDQGQHRYSRCFGGKNVEKLHIGKYVAVILVSEHVPDVLLVLCFLKQKNVEFNDAP